GEDNVRAQCRAFLENRLGAGVLTSLAHGDFAPWNLRTLEDGRVYVFDWEYAGPGQARLNDLCHHLFMPGVLVKGLDPRAAVEALWQALHEERLLAFVAGQGVAADQLPAYLLLYLLGLEARQVQLSRNRPGYLDDCLHHV